MLLKKLIPLAVLACMGTQVHARDLTEAGVAERMKGYDGAFVMLDVDSGKYFRYNNERCKTRFSPCSTFKIFNALAGLDCGAISGKHHLLKWDGKKRPIETHNQDQTLESAIKNSAVWYFQKTAEEIGSERMTRYITDLDYGNKDLSAGLTQFWLGSSLKISADEQVELLNKLYADKLPFSKASMTTVKEILEVERSPLGVLSGKTGTNAKDGKNNFGWFVGWVVHDGKPYVFATNISAPGALGRKARQISQQILHDAELI